MKSTYTQMPLIKRKLQMSASKVNVPSICETRRRYEVDDILAYHGDDFVRVAYNVVLQRVPDDSGREDVLAALRSGVPRERILYRLRYSAEGNQCGIELPGLRLRVALLTLFRIPLLGRLIEWLVSIWTLPRLVRRVRQLEIQTHARTLLTEHDQVRQLQTLQQRQSELEARLNNFGPNRA